jgi:hypothetical protein
MIISGKRQNKKQTARSEKAGISQPEILPVCCKHPKYRKIQPSSEELVHAYFIG